MTTPIPGYASDADPSGPTAGTASALAPGLAPGDLGAALQADAGPDLPAGAPDARGDIPDAELPEAPDSPDLDGIPDDEETDRMPPAAADATAPAPELRIAHMKFAELANLAMQMRARADAEWQRVLNLHVALIAVMVFFANQAEDYVVARAIVFAFYTYNIALLLFALRDARAGLDAVATDLRQFPPPARGGASADWLARPAGGRFGKGQVVLILVVWAVVGYLLLGALALGFRGLQP